MFFCIRRVYRGSIFFSLVLILHIRTYLGIKGDWFFSDLRFFSALVLCTNWCTTICITCLILHEIEYIKFVCNKFVLVLVQIDLRAEELLLKHEDDKLVLIILYCFGWKSLHSWSCHLYGSWYWFRWHDGNELTRISSVLTQRE